ncbi:MAG: RNA recognition motif-containing protein [Ramalina farinacea]|uniref:RNA recognition motif-containing protein n=1 Tax=Ramalina farinacea TaxID=258253 RepID=A0AA43QQ69_9LECA|nr:RNA recognition motif-containing protein [Ramalina farinacea]
MSRLKRRRLTEQGQDQVTLVESENVGEQLARPSKHNDSTTVVEGEDEKPTGRATLFVRCLSESVTSDVLAQFFSHSFPTKHATVVVDPTTKKSRGFGFVTFADVDDARSAHQALQGAKLDGRNINLELAQPRYRRGGSPPTGSPNLLDRSSRSQLVQPAPRLIVRNLPWSIKSEDQLAKLFMSYGKIKHVNMPSKRQGLSPGFGFVLLRGRQNAEKALESMNGKEIEGRRIAVDWAVEKSIWDTLERDTTARGAKTDSNGSVKSEDGGDATPPIQATEGYAESVGSDVVIEATEENGTKEHNSESRLREFAASSDDHPDSTLFVRNLPFTANDEALSSHFAAFGSVRYARVVLDAATERSKGTGFVSFYNPEDADACLRKARRLQPLQGSQKPGARGDTIQVSRKSVLEDTNTDANGLFTLDGRVLQVTRAVDRAEATRLAFNNNDMRETRDRDRRRLYLLSEGNISSDDPRLAKLPQSEIRLREESAKQRQALIRSNPALHLSLTRLSVRNMPRKIDSKGLKLLARQAVVGFAQDVRNGVRRQLSREESTRGGPEMISSEKERKVKGKGIVKQAKVVFEGRDGGKVAEGSGAGRSRGYGFVEYSSHRWALMGLRWLNGHAVDPCTLASDASPSTVPDDMRKKRLVVEFAIENAQVVSRRQQNESKARERSKLVSEQREREGAPGRNKQWTADQLMARTRKGEKSSRPLKRKPGNEREEELGVERKQVSAEAEKAAKRQRIIGKKRNVRKLNRKG